MCTDEAQLGTYNIVPPSDMGSMIFDAIEAGIRYSSCHGYTQPGSRGNEARLQKGLEIMLSLHTGGRHYKMCIDGIRTN